jgi:hypothetical protein
MELRPNTCTMCRNQFEVTSDDLEFYKKMGVPVPAKCPECRFRLRALWRNEMTLYTRACMLCQKSVISMYSPKLPYTIYCEKCWDSDQWDPRSYARDYDPGRPFFDQLKDLLVAVPKKTTYVSSGSGPNINSEYTNFAGGNKNCYLIFNSGECEDVLYSRSMRFCKDSLDLYFSNNVERCYECLNVNQSNGVIFGQHSSGCVDSAFIINGSGLNNCFGCVNLRGKSYHFKNQPLEKAEYERRVHEIMGSHSKLKAFRKEFDEWSLQFPRRENANLKTVDSEGDYLTECKNARQCFEAFRCEDVRYVFSSKNAKDSYDILGYGFDSELLLDCVATGFSQRAIGCSTCEQGQEYAYSFALKNVKYCLGCDGLRGAQYCILNKQYEKEDYLRLREKIVEELVRDGQYGSMMPASLAPFGYNESVGQDNLPLTREEAAALGLPWQDDFQVTRGKETLKPEQIPDRIEDVQDSILKDVLACTDCSRNYRLTPAELQFYRKMVLPIPRQCFYCRHADRLKRRGPMKIFDRQCAKCQKAIKTTYSLERPEIVYCESCYQREVI